MVALCTQESSQLVVRAKLVLDKSQWDSQNGLLWKCNDSKLLTHLTLPSSAARSSPTSIRDFLTTRAIMQWNSLLSGAVDALSLAVFKPMLGSHLIRMVYVFLLLRGGWTGGPQGSRPTLRFSDSISVRPYPTSRVVRNTSTHLSKSTGKLLMYGGIIFSVFLLFDELSCQLNVLSFWKT